MIKNVKYIFLALFITMLACVINPNSANAAIGDYTMTCGKTPLGDPVSCSTDKYNCVVCTEHSTPWGLRWVYDEEKRVFYCRNKDLKVKGNCSVTTTGGLEGESETNFLIFTVDQDAGYECVTNNFLSMYTSTCYGCEIVETLASAFVRAAAKAYNVAREAGNAILVVATIIWIGIFVLKNISSFTTVEPRQMLQQLMIQLFKVFIAFVILNSGIQTILHYTLEPIMLFGTDFADAILVGTATVEGM